jgi:hypothetical protein
VGTAGQLEGGTYNNGSTLQIKVKATDSNFDSAKSQA